MAGKPPNPNGANQHTIDPRQLVMWEYYVKELAKGIDNAYAAAIKAGYEETSAKDVTLAGWFMEKKAQLKRKEMVSLAEKVLHESLELDSSKSIINSKDGVITIDKEDGEIRRIKVDVAKTLCTTLGKNLGYSSRNELTGADGQDLNLADKTKSNSLISKLLGK